VKAIWSRVKEFFVNLLVQVVSAGVRVLPPTVDLFMRAWRWIENLLKHMLGVVSPSGGWAQKAIMRDKALPWRVRIRAWWSPSYALICVAKYYMEPGLREGLREGLAQMNEEEEVNRA